MKPIILVGILLVSMLLLASKSQAESLEGVPDIPWCKRGQTPKTHRCRNGSDSGGLYLVINGQLYLVTQAKA